MLDVGGGVVHHPFSMAQVGAQTDHPVAGPEAAAEQPMLVELLQPLGIVHVGLSARDILHVARIHQQHFEAAGFEDLEDRNPVHARRLHGDGLDAGLLEPIGQSVEIAAERPEGANRVVVPIAGHRNDMEGRADIDSSRIWVDRG